MEKKNNRNSHIMMNKGMKQKVSVLLIACLLLTGYHGLTISGKAEQTSKSESNEISVSGTEVRVQLLGEDLRRAAREAIEKGTKVEGSFLKGYSGDGELQKEYEAIFSPEKEVYEIPLDSISEGLSESLSEEEAGLQVFVERDAKDLESLVRKESKESLLLYDGNSQLAQLFPEGKKEEKQDRTEKAKEFAEGAVASSSDIEETAVASDSNIERRNTELTGSELITFLYKNKSEHKISFKLSVDGNQYPKLVVAPKAQLFKGLVEKLKKEEKKAPAEVKPAEKQEEKPAESKEEQAKEEPVKAESSEEKKQLAEENAPVEEKKELSEKEEKPISEVSIVSTEGKAEEAQPEAKEVEEKTEKSEERKEDKVETAEVESKEESAEKGVEAERDGAKSAEAEKEAANTEKQADEKGRFTGFLQEVLDHYEEFLAELSSARFRRYSLNELGRKTQNVEIKDFATVEVFYDEDAFTDEEGNTQEVVLKANRLLKKEEAEKEGEKLTDEQVEAMKEHSIYEGSDALDIRFVSKEDATKEVEPKNPVSVRLTFDKKAVPEEANADTIAIHHIVEDKDSGKVKYVETVLRSELEKEREKEELKASEGVKEDVLSAEGASEESKKEGIKKEEVFSNEDEKTEHKENITKEFMVESFSAYVVTWKEGEDENHHRIRFHYVDGDYKEIGPTLYRFDDWLSKDDPEETIYEKVGDNKFKWFSKDGSYDYLKIHNLYKGFPGYKLEGIFGQHKAVPGHPYAGAGFEVLKITNKKFTLAWSETDKETKVTTYHKKEYEFGIGCSYHEFYFRYKMCGIDQCKTKVQEVEPSLLHDKYITKNENGTYDLTLTGQTSRGKGNEKTKLDLVFVYDNTGNISAEDTDRTKKQMNALMDELSSEKSGFDARFALVTMNHEENPSLDKVELVPYSENVLNGEFNLNDEAITTYKRIAGTVGRIGDKELSQGYEIKDELYNDVTTMEFRRKKDIEEELKKVIHPGKKGSGANYAAAVRDVKSLTNWWDKKEDPYLTKDEHGNYVGAYGNFDRTKYLTGITSDKYLQYTSVFNLVRKDAKAVVVFIAGGNPAKTYIKADGVYEDYVKSDGKYYLTRAEYKKGQSIGTGLEKNYPALNIAKGELKYLVSLDSFYTIGVGPKENWNKMEEFTTSLPKGTYYRSFEASDGEKIKESFQNLLSDVSEKRIHSISITDTLSENVELVDGDNSVSGKLVKMKANKVEEDHVLSEAEMLSLGLKKIEAKQSYDSEKKRTVLSLTTDPEDFVLPAGYELRLVANIKPSALAYTNAAKASNLKFGEARTDLNDIFWNELRRKKGEDEKYGTSVNQKGLYTNDTASITYRKDKPGEKGGTPPTENYNKPIIHVEPVAYLRIYKAFAHTDNKIYKASTGELTELGKQLAKNIQFEIWVREKGKQKLLTTINLGDARWVNGSFSQERKFVVDGYDVTIHTLENNFKDEKNRIVDRIAFTIHNLPTTNKDYRIVEKFVDQGAIHLENPDDDEGYGFERKDNGGKTESYNPVSTKDGGNTYVFTNLYKKKKVTTRLVSIEKQVQEYGASATSQKGTNDIFEFHLVPFKYINNNKYRNYYRGEINTVVNKLSGNLNGIPKPEVKQMTVKDINGTEKKEWVMVFKLKHGQKISMELGAKDKFQVYELRKEGYEDAKATETIGEKESKTAINKYQQGSDTFFCSDPLINSGQTLTFYNPRRITPPTGLHRELAPYLISIFGFVAMAGLYISINKNRRREI